MPITLPVEPSADLALGMEIALRDSRNNLLAIQRVDEIYEWDLEETAVAIFGKYDPRHPIIAEMHRWGKVNISGKLEVLQLPPRLDFSELRRTPSQTRAELEELRTCQCRGFPDAQPAAPRARKRWTKRGRRQRRWRAAAAPCRRHDAAGRCRPLHARPRLQGADWTTITKGDRSLLSLLPLAMRMAGPREAVWHAIIRRNYGAKSLHCRARPRRSRSRLAGQPILWTL